MFSRGVTCSKVLDKLLWENWAGQQDWKRVNTQEAIAAIQVTDDANHGVNLGDKEKAESQEILRKNNATGLSDQSEKEKKTINSPYFCQVIIS